MTRTHGIHEGWQPQTKLERDAVTSELEAILASSHFCNSKRYPAFLRYVVENALAGRTEQLKERTLGIEVFDRPPTFDTNSDTVVRYTAGEVRKRLLLYYSEHQHQAGIRISLPAGSYIPEFALGTSESSESTALPEHRTQPDVENGTEHETAQHTHISSVQDGGDSHAAWDHEQTGSQNRSSLWVVILIVVVATTIGIAGFILRTSTKTPQQTLVDRFWEPVLHDQRTVIVCTGSVVFANNNYSGVITANKDIDYSFVSFQNAAAIAQVSSVLARAGTAMQMVPAPTTPLTELSGHSVVLLGGYNNQWTMRLLDPLRFHFSPPTGDEIILDRQHPDVHWMRDPNLPYSGADDYAIVARYLEPATGSWIVAIAGVGRNGTEAAAQFITSPHYLEQLRERLGKDFSNHNLEAVLKVSVIDGKTGAPSLVAVHSW